MGHSLRPEIVYEAALEDPGITPWSSLGAYTPEATTK